jgi:hypothetical protein
MKTLLTATLSLALLPAWAQTSNFNLDALAAKAKQKAEVTLEGPLLEQALQQAPANLKGKMSNLKRLVVRHYEFDKPGQFTDADLDPVRKTVANVADWARVVNVKEDKETVEIYMQSQAGKTTGILLIAAEEKELTVLQVVGSVDLASLQEVVKSTIAYDLSTAGAQRDGH